MLIDSHHHLWKYSAEEYGWISDQMGVLKRDFWSNDLAQIAHDHGIDGFVTVQARQSIAETDALLELAEAQTLIRGVVGWVDFASDQAEQQLERYAGNPWLRGLRHVVQGEPDDRFILGQAFNRGISQLVGRDLVYDILIFAKQLGPSIEFAQHHADIPMVLDHIAKPTIQSGKWHDSWEADIRELAKCPNVSCKFSGVVTEVLDAEWDIDTIRRYWDVVLECFTPSRLMFGSDWPVCLLRTDYGRWLETVKQLASPLSTTEQDQLFGATAMRVYGLAGRS